MCEVKMFQKNAMKVKGISMDINAGKSRWLGSERIFQGRKRKE
jgi:hypothetical protein